MFRVELSRQTNKFLKSISIKEHEQCITAIEQLQYNPFRKRSGCDIKKLSGIRDSYRLRVRNIRFNYAIDKDRLVVYVQEAFLRVREYR